MKARQLGRNLIWVLILIAPATSAQAADIARGQALYENHCTTCHESQVHIRDHPKARTQAQLRQQVARWAGEIHKEWGSAEIEDVFHYLNATYYHFTN